ncbi:DeoR/GlpR family DNA-binding transcription regulator [Streptacidiphilus sp. N1-12]|uniref:DeoR/GlpR family DNA-binding transcription regulator n=2 Tax=Streptacidiphilus alkalitolerans TaxID=3342712 RepID=A0ABV6WQH5_9ACTN
MKRHERLNAILDLLATGGTLDVDDVAQELSASAATIRRDLDHLAQQQLLTRTHGGAVANATSYDLPLRYKTARRAGEKQRIGAAAAALVPAGAVVGLNGGTTTTEVARALAIRADLQTEGTDAQITLVTNALNIAAELTVRPHVKIVVTGGVARPQSYELTGSLANGVLEQLALDIVVLGVDAVNVDLGASAHHEGEATINRLMVSRAELVVVVADSSKLDRRAFARICPLSEVDVLVTDTAASAETVQAFEAARIKVIRA